LSVLLVWRKKERKVLFRVKEGEGEEQRRRKRD